MLLSREMPCIERDARLPLRGAGAGRDGGMQGSEPVSTPRHPPSHPGERGAELQVHAGARGGRAGRDGTCPAAAEARARGVNFGQTRRLSQGTRLARVEGCTTSHTPGTQRGAYTTRGVTGYEP